MPVICDVLICAETRVSAQFRTRPKRPARPFANAKPGQNSGSGQISNPAEAAPTAGRSGAGTAGTWPSRRPARSGPASGCSVTTAHRLRRANSFQNEGSGTFPTRRSGSRPATAPQAARERLRGSLEMAAGGAAAGARCGAGGGGSTGPARAAGAPSASHRARASFGRVRQAGVPSSTAHQSIVRNRGSGTILGQPTSRPRPIIIRQREAEPRQNSSSGEE